VIRAGLLVLAAVLLAGAARAEAQVPPTPSISVTGSGLVRLAPDEARFAVSVRHTSPTRTGARRIVRRRVERILRALAARGVGGDAVRTEYAAITRVRVRTGTPRRLRTRYRSESTLTARTGQVDRLGELFDAVAAAGGDVSGPDFGFADPTAGETLAVRAALADARRRAEDAAAQLGLSPGAVLAVDIDPEGDGAGAGAGGGEVRRDATPILPGEREITATVRVTYALVP